MQNECIPLYRGGHPDLTGHATGAITGGTFLNSSGTIQSGPLLNTATDGSNIQVATATAGGETVGVAAYNAASATKVAILRPGNTVPMVADGNISFGDKIEVGTGGKPKTLNTGVKVGEARSTATSGAVVYIEILD